MSEVYYESQRRHIASEYAWKEWIKAYFEDLQIRQPKDSWERTVRVLGLQKLDYTPDEKEISNLASKKLPWMADNGYKNVHPKERTESHYKLKTSDVRAIKKMLQDKVLHKEIAKIYGVSKSSISSIACGARWGHV